ncbi:hypothetical protein SLS62_006532 [Diatrype stigma]|uniref:Rhodopsin domain-containing protein n=1 Tax=Diatrype stigma TaxID=117547 RepID=A0AAN9UQG1_9PEZI
MSDPTGAASQGGVSWDVYLGVGATLNVLAAMLVVLRCMTNYSLSKLGVDDVLVDPTTPLTLLLKMVVLIAIFVAFTLWSTKAPILALYVKLFGVRKWLRWVCFITLFVTGLNFIGSFILPIVACDTRSPTPDIAGFQTCQNATVTGGIWSGFISIIEDVIIFCIPIPSIAQLNLKLSKKIGIFVVFFSGIITIEANTALMVGCAPAVKAFWVTFITKSNTHAKSQSSKAASYWQPSSRLARSGVNRTTSATSTNQIYDPNVTNASYILMETPRGSQVDLEASKPHAK